MYISSGAEKRTRLVILENQQICIYPLRPDFKLIHYSRESEERTLFVLKNFSLKDNMKFFAPLIVAGSVHGRVDVNENNFVLIPDGYRGFFQDLNVTQLIQENRDDEMFYEFEEKVCLNRKTQCQTWQVIRENLIAIMYISRRRPKTMTVSLPLSFMFSTMLI